MTKQGYTELTLDLLNQSPEAGNLLVQLHDKHKLYALAKTRQPDARAELASIMAELLDLGLNQPQNELITDVLMSLIKQAEIDLKQAVSERLASMGDVPLRLAVYLANEEILVADPMLRRSGALDDNDLIYIVKAQTEAHWKAIASRASISEDLINVLVDTKSLDTAIELTENKNIRLTSHAIHEFSGMAKTSDRLAQPFLMREEIPSKIASQLYGYVGTELKKYIESHFDKIDNNLVGQVVDDIVFEMEADEIGEYTPSVKMILTAEKLLANGRLNIDGIVDNLRRGQISNFMAMFSVYCGLPIETVVEMVNQKTAQGLAVACKAMSIQKADFVNIFLLTSRVRGGKIIDQRELALALSYYDAIKADMAKNILNQSRH